MPPRLLPLRDSPYCFWRKRFVKSVAREKSPRWLQSVRDRLQEEYINVPSLRQIAVEVGVHPTYLATSFQQHFGVSIGEFVRLRRIEQAQEMLADSTSPLSEVALRLGFSDQSHFCRTFKKQTGLTPLEYRRLLPQISPPFKNLNSVLYQGCPTAYNDSGLSP